MSRPGTPSDPIATVRAYWGEDAPEEVLALAQACRSLGSQTQAARAIGYSSAVVSGVLSRKYRGSYNDVFAAIRDSFIREDVTCPVYGPITGAQCAEHQRIVDPTGRDQVAVYRACREGCPHSSLAPYRHVRMRRKQNQGDR